MGLLTFAQRISRSSPSKVAQPRPAGFELLESRRLMSTSLVTAAPVAAATLHPALTATTSLPAPVSVSPGTTTSPGPGPQVNTLTPTLTWKPVTITGFSGYKILLYDVTTGKATYFTAPATATSFTVPDASKLTLANTYVWNVSVVYGTVQGPASQNLFFHTPTTLTLTAPVAISPGTVAAPGPQITTRRPTLTWKPIAAPVTGYEIHFKDVTTGVYSVFKTSPTATSYTFPTNLPAGDSFIWNVRAVNGTVLGPPSATLAFRILPAPTPIGVGSPTSPGPTTTTTTPTLSWKPVTGVTFDSYEIRLYNVTQKTVREISVSPTATSYTFPTALTKGDVYAWSVYITIGTTDGPNGNYLFFTVG